MCFIILTTLTGAGGFWLWQRRRRVSKETTRVDMLRQPSQKMHFYLAAAGQKNNDNYKAASQALNNYLETTLQTPVAGLTRPQLAQHLRARS